MKETIYKCDNCKKEMNSPVNNIKDYYINIEQRCMMTVRMQGILNFDKHFCSEKCIKEFINKL